MALEDTEDTKDFVLVAFNGRRDFFRVKVNKPVGLPVIWSLAASLEEEPLGYLSLLFEGLSEESVFILGIVAIHQVHENSVALPDGEVVIRVIN